MIEDTIKGREFEDPETKMEKRGIRKVIAIKM